MIRHIVFWKLKDSAEGKTKRENGCTIKEKLEALVGKIEGLISAEVGENYNGGDFDFCLNSTFADDAALKGYQTHPLHLEVRAFVHKVICDRTAVDFEIE